MTDGGAPGVPVHVVARRILDEAATVASGDRDRALGHRLRIDRPHHRRLGRRARERPLPRALPAGVQVLEPDAAGVLAHTNHFLDPVLARGERPTDVDATTRGRLESLGRRVAALHAAADATARARELDHESGICAHAGDDQPPDERSATLATIALDVATGRVHAHPGGLRAAAATSDWTTA